MSDIENPISTDKSSVFDYKQYEANELNYWYLSEDKKYYMNNISEEQYALAEKRIAEEGLQDRIHLLKSDYRALEGKFDKLVSIEMIEAVGHQYLDTYIGTINRLLKDDGIALLQAITIDDQRYEEAKNRDRKSVV